MPLVPYESLVLFCIGADTARRRNRADVSISRLMIRSITSADEV